MIESLQAGRITTNDHFVIAGYWAQLTTCTPTWQKHAVSIDKEQIEESIPIVAEHLARQKPHRAAVSSSPGIVMPVYRRCRRQEGYGRLRQSMM
jgi:hypothetical protein